MKRQKISAIGDNDRVMDCDAKWLHYCIPIWMRGTSR